jgi:Zn-dependent metalloprotease
MRRYRLLLAALVSGSLAAGTVVLGVACSQNGGSGGGSGAPAPAGLTQLEQDTGVRWGAIIDPRFGTTSFLFPKSTPPVWLTSGMQPAAAAMAFFVKYGAVFSMTNPAQELTSEDSGSSQGLQFASFLQTEGAVPVYGTRLTMVFDSEGHIEFVAGIYIPKLYGFSTNAALSPAEATAKAQANMATLYPASQLLSLESTPAPELTIYALGASPALAYSLVVSYASDTATDTTARQRVVMVYVVDANSGAILQALPGQHNQYAGSNVVQVAASGKGQQVEQGPFPALGTATDGGTTKAPYYLQINAGKANTGSLFQGVLFDQVFVRSPTDSHVRTSVDVVLTSKDANSWDTVAADPGISDPGSAVDAYYYVLEIEDWWRTRWGRDGYDGKGTPLGILVHDTAPSQLCDITGANCTGGCSDNAFWDGHGTIHVCPSSGSYTYATSVDLGVMGHEFQHAVTGFSLDLIYSGQSGAIDESLSDIFGEFISHEMPPRNADCVFGNTWVPGSGLRNMVDPHATMQPDSLTDSRYVNPDDKWDLGGVHTNDGIPNRAWSLMTFGGQVETTGRKVAPSLALGWFASEQLYQKLLATKPVPGSSSFSNLANALVGLAGRSGAKTAVACAWYAVAVYDKANMNELGVDPCSCSGPDVGMDTCDAATDAAQDDASMNADFVCLLSGDGGAPLECYLGSGLNVNAEIQATCAGVANGKLLAACPSASLVGCCADILPVKPLKVVDQYCFYVPFEQATDGMAGPWEEPYCVKYGAASGLDFSGGGKWSTTPMYGDGGPADAHAGDSGSHDAGSDGKADAVVATCPTN